MGQESKRSRGYRADGDGTSGKWKRRNDPSCGEEFTSRAELLKTLRADCDDRDGCPACGMNDGTHREGCVMPEWRPVVLQHEIMMRHVHTDESLAQSSTGQEACRICDGTGEDCDGNPCGACCATGTKARPAKVDPRPTIAPGTMKPCGTAFPVADDTCPTCRLPCSQAGKLSTHVLCTTCAAVVPRKEAKQIGTNWYCRKHSGEEG